DQVDEPLGVGDGHLGALDPAHRAGGGHGRLDLDDHAADPGQEALVVDHRAVAVGGGPRPVRGGLDGRDHVAHVPGADAQVIQLADLAADAVLGVQRAVQHGPAAVDVTETVPVGDA